MLPVWPLGCNPALLTYLHWTGTRGPPLLTTQRTSRSWLADLSQARIWLAPCLLSGNGIKKWQREGESEWEMNERTICFIQHWKTGRKWAWRYKAVCDKSCTDRATRVRQWNNNLGVVIPHHPPQVLHCAGQRILGNDELFALPITLMWMHEWVLICI